MPQVIQAARDPGAPRAGRTRRLRPLAWVGCTVLLGPPGLRAGLGALVPVGALVALWRVRPLRWVVAGVVGAFGVVLAAWLAIPPSNERAKAANDDPRFSVRIRECLPRMAPTAERKG